MEREVEIARLGAQGDGVAEGFDGPLYVPFALPGSVSGSRLRRATTGQLSPGIAARLTKLKTALAPLAGGRREARVGLTETPGGIDIVIEGARPKEAALAAFAGETAALGVARLTCDSESIGPVAAPEVELSGVAVKLPPGAFLQASGEAETVMAELVREGVGDARRIADLFAGLGTFTFALARQAAVDAFEADETALESLAEAWRKTQGLKPVKTSVAISSAPRSAPRSLAPTMRSCSTRRGPAPPRKPRCLRSRMWRGSSSSPAIRERSRAIYASSSMAATASRVLRQSTSSCSRTMSRW